MANNRHQQKGVSFVLWLIALFPLFGFATLAIDVNNMFFIAAELQNAADAGALAGAARLTDSTAATAAAAAAVATSIATANKAQRIPAESAASDVKVGCWLFSTSGGSFNVTGTGTCGATTNPNNAIQVTTRRSNTPIQAIFGKFIGFNGYNAAAIATAYRQSLSSPTPPPNPLPTQVDGRVVLCPFDETAYPDTGTTCLILATAGNEICGGADATCTVRRLDGEQTINVGDYVLLKPGGGNVASGEAPYNEWVYLALVNGCPKAQGPPPRPRQQVTKIKQAKNIRSTGDPCVVFTTSGSTASVVLVN